MHYLIYYVLPFVVVLGVLIFFHELGHFLVAKLYGVKVLKFSLGFGPKLTGFKRGDTEYLISAVPLGGYVKMLGEKDDEEDEGPLSAEEAARSFSNQTVGRRIAIVAAGPVFNLLLALVIFCLTFLVSGAQVLVPEVGQVREGSPAETAGFQKNDMIVAVDGIAVDTWEQVQEMVKHHEENEMTFTLQRDGAMLEVRVRPEVTTIENIFGEEVRTALIGIVSSGAFKTVPLGPLQAVWEGARRTWEMVVLTWMTIVKLFERVVPIETLGGPILIGQMTGQLAQENWTYLFPFMAVISVNLGILNLLPVPILDGGVILILLVEWVIRKPISPKAKEMAQKAGLFVLLMLMAIVFYNDISRLLQ
ncbi:RIP metalloprotease RseP [Desulfatiglans anilini]|uniref:RIP metalloprotease RseP n=1 Tax=Desulfatiglans anilini TaxID=90728 RepID=UPI00041261F5|nr:RIP metalloprotease RseP [Desulfatiglans anilini]